MKFKKLDKMFRFSIYLNKVKIVKNNLFTKHLLLTNLAISTTTSGIGDVIEQVFEIINKTEPSWNKIRTLKLAATGLPVGVVAHYWYIFLETNYKSILGKIMLTQLIYSPICLVMFFVTLGILNQSSRHQIADNIAEKGKKIYLTEWAIWPPALIFNFYFIPLKYRLLFDATVSLGFDVFNSYVVHTEFSDNKSSKSDEK